MERLHPYGHGGSIMENWRWPPTVGRGVNQMAINNVISLSD